jgi:hypothetical protein
MGINIFAEWGACRVRRGAVDGPAALRDEHVALLARGRAAAPRRADRLGRAQP